VATSVSIINLPESQHPKGRGNGVQALDAVIEAKDIDLAEKVSCIAPAKMDFGSVGIILTLTRVSHFLLLCHDLLQFTHNQDSRANELDCAELWAYRGMDRKKPDELSQPVYGAIKKLPVS